MPRAPPQKGMSHTLGAINLVPTRVLGLAHPIERARDKVWLMKVAEGLLKRNTEKRVFMWSGPSKVEINLTG